MVRLIARSFSTEEGVKQKGSSFWRMSGLFLLFDAVAIFSVGSYTLVAFKVFTDAETSLLTRLLLRSVGHSIFAVLVTSFVGWFHYQLTDRLGVDPHRATIVYSSFAAFLSLVGRCMQSSAENVMQATAFELFATGAEVLTLDGMLKGLTPIQEIRTTLTCSKPDDAATGELTGDRVVFCSDAIIMLTVSEAAALVICSAEVLLGRVNLGSVPGAPRKAASLIWSNFAIMLFGELVITDGIVEWLARTFKGRYVIDPSKEWQRMKTRSHGFLVVVVLCLSIYSCQLVLVLFRSQGCFTAYRGQEDEWSVTSCPPVPTNVTQMLAVGENFG